MSKITKNKKLIFCWFLESLGRKEQDSDSEPEPDPEPTQNVTDPKHWY
jgi:hypothetical protein